MRFIDFFSGAGGMRMGLERAGHSCVGFCEFDKFARQSYKAIFNTEGEWENYDVRTVKSAELPRADLWTYGFPCQGISTAGKQKGIGKGAEDSEADERSNLFFQITRLLSGLAEEDRPEWLLCENVKNLLSIDRGYGFARILYCLEEMGYDSEWQLFNTKYSYTTRGGATVKGIPQNRERVYIVSHLRSRGRREVFPVFRADRENTSKLQEDLTDKSHLTPISFAKPFDKPMSEMWIGDFNLKDAHTLLARDYKGIANGSNGVLIDCDKTFTDLSYKQFNNTDVARCITARYTASPNNHTCESSGVLIRGDNMKYSPTLNDDSNELAINVIGNYSPSNHNASRVVTTDGIAPTVMENHGTVTAVVVNEPKVIDALYKSREPRESDICPTLRSERTGLLVKESLPMDYDEQDNTLCTDGTDKALKVIDVYNKRELKGGIVGTLTDSGNTSIGHCGTFLVAEHNDVDIYTGGTVGTLTTDGSSPKHNNRVIVEGNSVRIRRLTPRECWRLQGWGFLKEDGSWDDTAFEKAKASGVSDSQLYKQAGNGCSANVVMAIGLTLKEIENSFS